MKTIKKCLILTLLCIGLFAFVYPLFIWGIAQAEPNAGKGEIIEKNGKLAGYPLIGQSFTDDRYFYSRPSAVGYNAAATGGSNKGSTNPDYLKEVQARVDSFLAHNPGVQKGDVPVDLVTASGGGLDPHISPKAAFVQVARIAKVRQIPEDKVRTLVAGYMEKPLFGLVGTPTVNVLKLNLALDDLK